MNFSKKNNHFNAFFICIFLILSILTNILYFTFAQTTREQDMAELARLEAEAKTHQQEILTKQKEQVSLKRDISLLDLNIKNTATKIKITDNNIKGLAYNITDKNQKIKTISEKIEDDRKQISALIRKLSYKEYSDVYLLSNKSISDILDNSYNQSVLQSRLYQILLDYQNNKQTLVAVKTALESDKSKQEKFKSDQATLKRQAESDKTTKNQVLNVTKGEEAKYRTLLAQTQAKIDTIRARLFGLRDIKSISFGQAYDYAKVASANTGVRPALILAILQQESALGANVGSCFVTDFNTGSGVTKSGSPRDNVMKPSRDVPHFVRITGSLGLDPKSTVVSCPIPSAGGWGGAMGPSQFIPSTWNIYSSRIASLTGAGIANPWNANHAITATALYLQDLGARAFNTASEKRAACSYYGTRGSTCSYGNQVLTKVANIQADIDTLEKGVGTR